MYSTFGDNHFDDELLMTNLLGHSRDNCTQLLAKAGVDSLSFAHWLAIPSQQLLLVFRHQQCVAVDDYKTVS